jgi:hypothetical protein
MKRLIIILFVVLTGCGHVFLDNQDIDITFNSFDEMSEWIIENIEYKSEKGEIWQTPEETYLLKAGDCEDISFLTSYFLRQLNISHKVIVTRYIMTNNYHMAIKLTDEQVNYEPQTGEKFPYGYNGVMNYLFSIYTYEAK